MVLRNTRHLLAGAGALAAALLVAVACAVSSSAAPAASLAAAPSGATASAGVDSAAVSFTRPAASTPPVNSYTVTAYPGGEQGFGATSPVSVTGLEPSVAYTFSVTAASAGGRSGGSAQSASITTLPLPAGVTPPALSALKASLVSFFASGSGGTELSYSDSAAATSTIAVIRVRDGFKHAGGCVVVGNVGGKRCTSLLLVGTLTHVDVAGANRVRFDGRIAGHALPAGLYQLRITPSLGGVAGNTAKTDVDIF
jgi:hypothetical protein